MGRALNVLIAGDIDRSLFDLLAGDRGFHVTRQPVRSEEELAAIVGDCEVLVTRAYNRVSRRVIEAAPRLTLIAQGTSGIDNIDLQAARERSIGIVHLPGENANAVAELVIGWMLAMTRTVPSYTREVAGGRWNRDDCATRHEMQHYVLGIVGLGEVGRRVARLARAFRMRVQAVDPYITEADFTTRDAQRVGTLAELLATSGIVTLHVPLTEETRRMIGAAEIASMRPGTFLINAARGEVLDQRAALLALASGHLGGLGLDVFDPEPPEAPFPDDPRLILTPHIGGCTFECRGAIAQKLYEKIRQATS